MDLRSKQQFNSIGLFLSEAITRLVDSHATELDKRAAMLLMRPPQLSRDDAILHFDFKIESPRQPPVATRITIRPESPEPGVTDIELRAIPKCACLQFSRERRCPHSLASSWWLQEQLSRHVGNTMEFFMSLEDDPFSMGRMLIDDVISLSKSDDSRRPKEISQLQWRIALSSSHFYSPLQIKPYEQRPRKNGKGWTKGREIRLYDLALRDYSDNRIDGRIAGLVCNNTSYSHEFANYVEFEAVRLLVGHPNVTWDDPDATPITVHAGEFTFGLERVTPQNLESPDASLEVSSLEDELEMKQRPSHYRPSIGVRGMNLNLYQCAVLIGQSSPVDPQVIIADRVHNRLVVCPLPSQRSGELIRRLFRDSPNELLLDQSAAEAFVLAGASVNSLVRVELPDELAGPVVDTSAEIIFELRPCLGAGVKVALTMFDARFNRSIVPGDEPEIVTCLTTDGPIRLRRNLAQEKQLADAIVQRFELGRLITEGNYCFTATTDESALEVLSRLYAAGEEAPRMTWPEGETIRIRSEITPSALKVRVDDRNDWFGISGTVELDGHQIALADLLGAVRERRSLVQVGDREFARISDAFRKRLEQLGDVVIAERGSLRIADAAVPAVQELIGEDVSLEASARWHESIRRLQSLAEWTPQKPANLQARLRDYQLEGYRWLARLSHWGVGGVLADDMGLGKTVQTLAVLLDRADEGPTLVVAPTSVGDNWAIETKRFAPDLKPMLYRESNRDQLIESADAGDIVIVSYQLLQRDSKRFASRPWHTLVLDEAQFIKNSQTKTAQAVRRIEANWRVGLSGTPLENHLGELWSLFRTLSPGLLGSWERFRSKFAEPIQRHHDDQRRQSLAMIVRPFILRRTKNNVLKELPPRTEVNLQAQLSSDERALYEQSRLAAVAELSGVSHLQTPAGDQRIRTLAWLTRLRQLACHPSLVEASWTKSSAKLDLLLELVDELRDGEHRALVFSQFVKHLTVVRKVLDQQGISYQYLDGSTPAKERQRRVDAFQAGEGDLFLISLKAGGTGLNLTAADYVIHLDPWWNPAVEDQATDRAHRIGQERPVTVYRLVAAGTIEEQILELHADKRELVAGVLDGTDTAGKLDTNDLIEMIKQGARSALTTSSP
jgi:superfamily II DNA or RNA helicase